MVDKSGVAPQVLPLPEAGGSLVELGETFSPDIHTGTGNYVVSLDLPAGRGAHRPDIALSYSSAAGNGPFGLGWELSVPLIARKTTDGIPRYEDDDPARTDADTFILAGSEDLILISVDGYAAQYRPRTETSFSSIEHRRDASKGDDYWLVREITGVTSWFGTPGLAGRDPAVVANPETKRRKDVFSWRLTRTEDPFGNRTEYAYRRDIVTQGSRVWDQLYIDRIEYSDWTLDSESGYLIDIKFKYEDRHDAFSSYRSGFETRTRLRCKQIEVWTHTPTAMRTPADQLFRTYILEYLDKRIAGGEAPRSVEPRNGVSLLSRLRFIGNDGNRPDGEQLEELPPIDFGYTQIPDPASRKPESWGTLPFGGLSTGDLELFDAFGCGLPSLLYDGAPTGEGSQTRQGIAAHHSICANRGAGRIDPPEVPELSPNVSIRNNRVRIADVDGDGVAELLLTDLGGASGYYDTMPVQLNGHVSTWWPPHSYVAYPKKLGFSLADSNVQLLDVDGDGVVDAIRSGDRSFEVFINKGKQGWRREEVPRKQEAYFPDVSFSDAHHIRLARCAGDGPADVVRIGNGQIECWPHMGYGKFGQRLVMKTPTIPNFVAERVMFADVDGDGYDDFVYIGYGEVTVCFNRAGNEFSAPIKVAGTPKELRRDAVRAADMRGTGTTGLFWCVEQTDGTSPICWYLDLVGATKPYLLSSVRNNRGVATSVQYSPSTHFLVSDIRTGRPWKTRLPMPVQCVESICSVDEITGASRVSRFRYHHGLWDGFESEFRGFGMVEQDDADLAPVRAEGSVGDPGANAAFTPLGSHVAPPTTTKTWFHQGMAQSEIGEWTEISFADEFWQSDQTTLSSPVEDLEREVQRDAMRSLRGQVLRQEIFSNDGSAYELMPFSVAEYQYRVLALASENRRFRYWSGMSATGRASLSVASETSPGSDETVSAQRSVFFPFVARERTTSWERGDDPKTQIVWLDDYNAFGRPLRRTTVGLPRRKAHRRTVTGRVIAEAELDEKRILARHDICHYAVPDDGVYVHDRIAETCSIELSDAPAVHESDPLDLLQVLKDQTSAALDVRSRFLQVPLDWRPTRALPDGFSILSHIRNHYDGDDRPFRGREAGKVGPYGALVRSEALASDAKLFASTYMGVEAFRVDSDGLPDRVPVPRFLEQIGYKPAENSEKGLLYYVDTERRFFDFQDPAVASPRGLLMGIQDSLGNLYSVKFDVLRTFPKAVVDPLGLVRSAEYDYRVLKPKSFVDPNGNTTNYRYTPLGMLRGVFLESSDGQGGTETEPEIRMTYHLRSWEETQSSPSPQPCFVHTWRRTWHVSQRLSDETLESRQYTDGYGRLLQTRTCAASHAFGIDGSEVGLPPSPREPLGDAACEVRSSRVVISGWQTYDNKGRVIESFEPGFGFDWEYTPSVIQPSDLRTTYAYDALGRVVRTVYPDGSETLVVHGKPRDLATPTEADPTPWETYLYDANDLEPPLLENSSKQRREHRYTPTSTILDVFGRAIAVINRNGDDPARDWHVTRYRYDLRNNLLSILDPSGQVSLQCAYDLQDRKVAWRSIDSNERLVVFDACGNAVLECASNGGLVTRQYDIANRLIRVWARDGEAQELALREILHYGDDSDPAQPKMVREQLKSLNLLGRLHTHYDQAGLLLHERFDFKGNVTEKRRRVISDESAVVALIVDWHKVEADQVLDDRLYETSMHYDASSRITRIIYPDARDGSARPVLTLAYDEGGLASRVELNGTPYLYDVCYNPKGQRTFALAGNGLMFRYRYDLATARLVRIRVERARRLAADIWTGSGSPVYDSTYSYDRVGNVTVQEDTTPDSGVQDAYDERDRLVRHFAYDPMYRLVYAEGRVCKSSSERAPWLDSHGCGRYSVPGIPGDPSQQNAPDLCERYAETYGYGVTGNLETMRRSTPKRAWVRTYKFGEEVVSNTRRFGSNQLTSVTQGQRVDRYKYDASGNLRKTNSDRRMSWDYQDRLVAFEIRPDSASRASTAARYLYDAGGRRIKKVVRHNGSEVGISTVYVDGLYEHVTDSSRQIEHTYLHVGLGSERIATLRRGTDHPADVGPPIQYQIADLLGSCVLVVGGDGEWVNREEYTPYGETTYGGFAHKRYRFGGKERDEESGLYLHGARFYACWLGRWVSPDPAGPIDGPSEYVFCRNNPLTFRDMDGHSSTPNNNRPDQTFPGDYWAEGSKDIGPGEYEFHNTDELPDSTTDEGTPGQGDAGGGGSASDRDASSEDKGASDFETGHGQPTEQDGPDDSGGQPEGLGSGSGDAGDKGGEQPADSGRKQGGGEARSRSKRGSNKGPSSPGGQSPESNPGAEGGGNRQGGQGSKGGGPPPVGAPPPNGAPPPKDPFSEPRPPSLLGAGLVWRRSWFDSKWAKMLKLTLDLIRSLTGKPIQKLPPPPRPPIVRKVPRQGGPPPSMLLLSIDPALIMRLVDPCNSLGWQQSAELPPNCWAT